MSTIRYNPKRTVLVFLDEYGNSHLKKHDRPLARYLSVCAVLINQDYYVNYLVPALDDFKERVFGDRSYYLHYSDIFRREAPFDIEECEKRESFLWNEITDFLSKIDMSIHNICIDKNVLLNKIPPLEGNPYKDPYEYALALHIERLVFYLDTLNERYGDQFVARIVGESRTPKQNRIVQDVFKQIHTTGHLFFELHNTTTPKRIQKAIPSSNLPLHGKERRIHGLELVDIVTNSMFWLTLQMYGRDTRPLRPRDELFKSRVEPKIAKGKSGKSAKGWGMKLYP